MASGGAGSVPPMPARMTCWAGAIKDLFGLIYRSHPPSPMPAASGWGVGAGRAASCHRVAATSAQVGRRRAGRGWHRPARHPAAVAVLEADHVIQVRCADLDDHGVGECLNAVEVAGRH